MLFIKNEHANKKNVSHIFMEKWNKHEANTKGFV